MTAYKGLGTYGNAAGVVTPTDHKGAQAGQVVKASGNLIRHGLFWGGSATIVSGKANMSYDVAPYTCVTTRGASAGAVFGGNDGVLNVVTTAAPGSNSRIDIIYHWHREYSLDGTDSNPVIGVVQGTAAAIPTAPSLAAFPGAIELARVTVPSGITATTSATITQSAPFTAMAGGIVPVRTTTERDAGTWVESQHVWDISTDIIYQYTGSAWTRGTVQSLQLDTTNSTAMMITQVGKGKILGSGSTAASEAVTFPIAFSSIPVITVTIAGTRATGTFNDSALATAGLVLAGQYNASTTGFSVRMDTTGTLGNTTDFYYTWSATGTL